jgi:hypothetical protein
MSQVPKDHNRQIEDGAATARGSWAQTLVLCNSRY